MNASNIKDNLNLFFKNAAGFIVRNRIYFLSFFLPAALLFLAYIIFGVYPFGKRSVLALDLNAQYVYYFDYMYDVFAGKESLFYSWSRNLSGEFMGIIGYYLASPFNFLVWLFPRSMITEGLLTMMLAKAGAAGLSASFFLRRHKGYSEITSLLFSVMFSLCGFFVVQTMNPMWLDGIIALPLVTAGIENICDKRGFVLYVLSLVYIFTANFYIGYMTGIFSALYFIYYQSSGKSVNGRLREYLSAAARFAVSSVCAILMSCFMILPVYKSLSNGKFEFSVPDYSITENFDIADIFIKLFPTTYDTVKMEGMPILYCGTLSIIFALIYFGTRKFPARERIAGAVFLGVMVLCMYIRPVDMMWHGGQMPNWLPYRYSFMISFLLVVFGAGAFEKIRSIRGKSFCVAFCVLLAMLLFADLDNESIYYNQVLTVAVPLAVLSVIIILAYSFAKCSEKRKKVMSYFMIIAVCAECLLNTEVSLRQMNDDIVFSDRSTYLGTIPYTREITDQIHEYDDGFYRMEKTYHRCVNDPIAVRMYGLSHSSSTLNARAIALLKSLGFTAREHYTRYDGATMLTDDIFGVKYILAGDKSTVPYDETLDNIKSRNDAEVYVNSDALGIAYLADKDIIGYNISESSPFLAQNKLSVMLSGNKGDSVFRAINNIETNNENIRSGTTTDGHYSFHKKNENSPAWLSFTMNAPDSGPFYMYLPTNYERETKLYVNGVNTGNYFLYENYSIEYLGTYNKGDKIEVKLELLDDVVYYLSAQFYYIDANSMSRFNETMSYLNRDTSLVREYGTKLSLSVNAEKDCALFTTIPAEEGWTVYVDGKETPWETALSESLICIPVESGKHEIILEFFPAGLKNGLILTVIGVLLFIIIILLKKRMKSRQ